MENFTKTLNNLKEGLALAEVSGENVLVLTGLVSLFEICFEQAWNTMKSVLHASEFIEARSGSPKTIIKLAYREGMISSHAVWLDMLEDRGLGVHTYNEDVARDIVAALPRYAAEFELLQQELASNGGQK